MQGQGAIINSRNGRGGHSSTLATVAGGTTFPVSPAPIRESDGLHIARATELATRSTGGSVALILHCCTHPHSCEGKDGHCERCLAEARGSAAA